MEIVTPYGDTGVSKKKQVAAMFNNIAGNYDFLNHFLSLGIDKLWRKKAIRLLSEEKPKYILDMATGTADFALEALKLNPEKITGADISEGMLQVGRAKVKARKAEEKIELILADSEALPFEDERFDAYTVGFGVRNFENLEKGLTELNRVLKKDGTALILEFSKPKNILIKKLFSFYFYWFCPFFGKLFSKDNRAYTYLPKSVDAFPSGKDFIRVMEKCGYQNIKCIPLSFGIASIYYGKK